MKKIILLLLMLSVQLNANYQHNAGYSWAECTNCTLKPRSVKSTFDQEWRNDAEYLPGGHYACEEDSSELVDDV